MGWQGVVVQSGHRGTINSKLWRKISRVVKSTIEQDATKRRDEWMQLKSKVEWLEAEKRQQQQKEQYRTWTLAGTQEQGPSFLVKGKYDPNGRNWFM